MAEGKKLSEKLLDVMRQYKLLSLPKLQRAVTLNYNIVANSVVYLDIKNKILTIEYQIPCEVERNIVGLMKDSGIEFTKDIMPNKIIGIFLQRLSIPIYYEIAKKYRWSRSWIDRHDKTVRGDYWKRDTIIKLTLHPMSNAEIQQDIFKSVRDAYIAIRVTGKDTETDERKLVTRILSKWEEKADEYSKSFIAELKYHSVVNENLKLLCSDASYKKAINVIARNHAGEQQDGKVKDKVKVCQYSGCNKLYPVTSKHKRKFCSDLCRALAFRNKKKSKSIQS